MDHNQARILERRKAKTKFIPPIMMLTAGLITSVICLVLGYELLKSMLILFVVMLIFAILGTVIKSITDRFRVRMDYSDFFDEDGEIVEK